LDSLSTHTRIEEVSDVDIESIHFTRDYILAYGTGAVSVSLQYGSDGDLDRGDGVESNDSFPFTFTARLNPNGTILELQDFEVDTSSFYKDSE